MRLRISDGVRVLQSYSNRTWYPPLLGFLAAIDNFVLFLPSDGILMSSVMLHPKRWFSLALYAVVGSTIGAFLLVTLVEYQGLSWILRFYPGLDETEAWTWALGAFQKYGLACVFLVCLTPFTQLPVIVLASFAQTPVIELTAVIFAGRSFRGLLMAYLASHAPRVLRRLWGIQGELQEAGIDIQRGEP